MKRIGKPAFFIVALLIVVLTYAAFFGIYSQNGDMRTTYIKGASDIRWGIDIRGGVEATFVPANGVNASDDDMNAAKAIIELRLMGQNITDYELYADLANDRIIVRFPWKSDEVEFDPEEAINELSATAELTFREGEEVAYDEEGNTIPSGITAENVILVGKDIKKATVMVNTQNVGKYEVRLELQDEGPAKFSTATSRLATKGKISIWMDQLIISAPSVNTAITDGVASITGDFTLEEAQNLANRINAGAIPFKLETRDFGTINPSMGASSLDAMLLAGVIAFFLIAIIMLYYFRLPGFVACIALLGQIGGMIAMVSGFFPGINSFTLTLPGIAGMILSIGMGVDANVITNERIREEVLSGKTLDGALDAGSENSFSAIFDGNITVIIVAVVLMGVFGPPDGICAILLTPFLWMFGAATTGAIYSFGYTLFTGIIFNFIMGVTLSRVMTKSLSRFKFLRNKWLYGGASKKSTENGGASK